MQMLSLGLAAVVASASGASTLPHLATLSTLTTMAPSANETASCCHASAHIQEILSLSELPMDRLLRVKMAMHPYTMEANMEHREGEEALPQAEALRSRVRFRERSPPIKRQELGGLFGGSSKQSKLATGFQLAITVLSFLAFGAYLISLVVAIVRNNNSTTTGSNTTQQPFVLVPSSAGRRRRRRREAPWMPPPLPEPESVFNALTTLAQAYAKFEGHDV